MFDSVDSGKVPPASVPCEEDWFDPAWLDQAPELSDTTQPPVSECAPSGWLALRLSRTAATGRLVMAETLVADLPGTLAAGQAGTVDTLKARAITETSYLLPREQPSTDPPPF